MKRISLCFILGFMLVGCAPINKASLPLESTANIIRDTESGLIWAKNISKSSSDANVASVRSYDECDAHSAPEACLSYLNSISYAGYKGWRLPTKAEFERLFAMAEDYKSMTKFKGSAETTYLMLENYFGFTLKPYQFVSTDRSSGAINDAISLGKYYIADARTGKIFTSDSIQKKGYGTWPVTGSVETPTYTERFSNSIIGASSPVEMPNTKKKPKKKQSE